MKNPDNEPPQHHPIDHAFFLELCEIQHETLAWGIWWFRDKQKAMDLLDEAVAATVDGRRKWPVGITLKRHLKWVMRSINSNRARKLGELLLSKHADGSLPEREDDFAPDPSVDAAHVLHCLSPEDLYSDAEGTLLAERMAEEIFEMTAPGSIERGVLVEARKENVEVGAVAKALGVTPRQVTRAKESLRITKVRPVLARYGFVDPKLTRKPKKTGEEQ